MIFHFTVDVNVERESGRFASREELAGQIHEALEQADWGEWTGENEGVYTTADWDVAEVVG